MATLIMLSSVAGRTKLPLQKGHPVILGRDPTCDLVLPQRSISRFHAQLTVTQGTCVLEDMHSTNGTFVNGSKIQSRVTLKDGDRITVHDIPMVFFTADAAELDEEATVREELADHLTRAPSAGSPADPAAQTISASPGSERGQLKMLIEISRALGSTLQIQEILPRLLDLLFRMFPPAVVGEIHLLGKGGQLAPVAMKHGREADSTDLTGAPFNMELIQQVFQTGEAQIQNDRENDAAMALEGFHQSTMCAPIPGPRAEPCGVVLLETNDSSYLFHPDDLELLGAVAILAGQAIGYSQAHEIVVQHDTTLRQMEVARQIQLSMLPRQQPQVAGYRFAHHYLAAERVGGDYFFYEMLRDGRVILGIADASGKGLPAAMNIARFAGEVRLRIAISPTLKSALANLNQFVSEGSDECMFITSCLCVLDPEQHLVALANAGHPPPLIKRGLSGHVEELQAIRRNFPLGIDGVFDAHPWTIQLNPGDQILLFTDGVTEAMNSRNELYGTDRLKQAFACARGRIDDVVQSVITDVNKFRDGRPSNDDTTIVAFERLPSQALTPQTQRQPASFL